MEHQATHSGDQLQGAVRRMYDCCRKDDQNVGIAGKGPSNRADRD